MAITTEQEQLEHELRIDLMRADIDLKQSQSMKSKQDWRLDPQRVVISAFLAGAAIMGAAGTILGYFLRGSGH